MDCPEGSVYDPSACPKTCQFPNGDPECIPDEYCLCENGFLQGKRFTEKKNIIINL